MMAVTARLRHSKLAARLVATTIKALRPMPNAAAHSTPPGYGKIVPILLGLAGIGLFLSCLPRLDRNLGFAPMESALHARALDYVENLDAAEGQVLRLQLHNAGRPLTIVTTRDDRPWRTFAPGEEVRLLMRPRMSVRGAWATEYIIDDFAAKWGGLIARAAAAALCDVAAVVALVLGRRRRSAAHRYPPPFRSPTAH